jgi:hypothetical protein
MNELGPFFEKRPKWAVAFAVLVTLGVLAGWGSLFFEDYLERRARDNVLSGLSDLTPTATVTVNGSPRPQPPVLEALRAVHHVESHHSSPLTPIQVEVRDGAKTIRLVVAQDSERPDE